MGGLYFGGTEPIEPTGRDDYIVNGGELATSVADDSDAGEGISYENPQTGEHSRKRELSPTAQTDRPAKTFRVPGGKAAVPKKIVADYDSDDGRIVSLKQQGYSDEYVADKLKSEGRIRYVSKTVGSRWLRLRKALEQAEEEKLDDELSDWHIGEDELLEQSVRIVDEKLEKEVEKLLQKKWKDISADLAGRLHSKKYTAKACEERYEANVAGTALLPIEIDPDQGGRRVMRDARIAESKQRRAKQAVEAQRAEEHKTSSSQKRKILRDEKNRQRIIYERKREEERNEAKRLKERKKTDRAEARAAKSAARAQIKAEQDWESAKYRAVKQIYRNFTGKRLRGAPCLGGRSKRNSEKDGFIDDNEDYSVSRLGEDEDEKSNRETEDDNQGSTLFCSGSSTDDGASTSSIKSNATKSSKVPAKAVVTQDTLASPRSIMTDTELDLLLFERGLPRRILRETHPQTVARLCAADEVLNTVTLNNLLGKHFAKTTGSKKDKIQRLQEHDAANSTAGRQGVKATDLEFKKDYEGYTGEYSSLTAYDN